jgi:hypothetical protein
MAPSLTLHSRLLCKNRLVLLFLKRFHSGLVDGSITLTFRQWEKPHVKVGGRYRVHPIGVVEVDEVTRVALKDVSDDDAVKSGFASRDEFITHLAGWKKDGAPATSETLLWKVRLHHGGDGDRVSAALDTALSQADVEKLCKKLAALDARAKAPWTRKVLSLISRRPKVAASKLAKSLGRETLPFKVDVRKLKKLGLTESFEVGYGISPRGRAFLKRRPRW